MEIEKLYQQALEFLETGEIKRAHKLGKILIDKGYSGGYEVLALCYKDEDKIRNAIKILTEGTKKIPQAWPLWRQLGNLYSDQENYVLARQCYDKAQDCHNADISLITYDRALTYFREEIYTEALRLLDELPHEWQEESAGLKASTLSALNKYEEAINHCRSFIAKIEQKSDEDRNPFDLSSLYTELASALWKKEQSSEALLLVVRALKIQPHQFALTTLREIRNLNSDKAKYFNLMVQGKWDSPIDFDEENRNSEFFRTYQIVADTLEEAFEFTKVFEPDEIAESLSIEEYKLEELDSPMLKGVYEASGHIFYSEE